MTVLKTCSRCKEAKPQTYFPKAKAWSDGLYPQCKECKNSAQREAYAVDSSKAIKSAYDYRQGNLEVVREKERQKSIREKETTPERVLDRNRRYYWRKQYGISPEQYKELLDKQDGCCGVCARHHTEFTKILAVDHDHRTLEIRGLLCTYCNLRVIGKHRDPELFKRAAEYLSVGTGLFTPGNRKRARKPRKAKA